MATAGDRRGPGPERAYAGDLPAAGPVRLSAGESHHLVRVRRVQAGDAVVLFDGQGGSVLGTLTQADPRAAVVAVTAPYPDREPRREVVLAVSLPEAGRADDLVSVLAELGVFRLVPLVCARTPTGRRDLPARRRERWGRLVREAAKVNGRSRLLRLDESTELGAVLSEAGQGGCLLLDPDPQAPALAACLPAATPVPWLLVGPEGGFTAEELAAADRAGVGRARLGDTALRTATAAGAAAAIALGTD